MGCLCPDNPLLMHFSEKINMAITNVVEPPSRPPPPPEKTEFQQRQHGGVPRGSIMAKRIGFSSHFLFSSRIISLPLA